MMLCILLLQLEMTQSGGILAESHRFGGSWTDLKLNLLEKYLKAYTTALKDKPSRRTPFVKHYVDAFAGTGYREERDGNPNDPSQALLFPDLAADEPQSLIEGSARRALKIEPRFDRYLFIERSATRCAELEALKTEFPGHRSSITVQRGDANTELQAYLKRTQWKSTRAVLFLDPYGMQVEWTTIEAIARTQAVDLWILFPLGIGVTRLLKRSGDIPESWRHRLDLLLGRNDWYERFYRVEPTPSLFGSDDDLVVKATSETIGRYFNERLMSIFPAVADEPKILRNSVNCPLYLLCFAAANKNGAPIALRIANHLLKEVQ
jgi:three-Cys-motif partner protein